MVWEAPVCHQSYRLTSPLLELIVHCYMYALLNMLFTFDIEHKESLMYSEYDSGDKITVLKAAAALYI